MSSYADEKHFREIWDNSMLLSQLGPHVVKEGQNDILTKQKWIKMRINKVPG